MRRTRGGWRQCNAPEMWIHRRKPARCGKIVPATIGAREITNLYFGCKRTVHIQCQALTGSVVHRGLGIGGQRILYVLAQNMTAQPIRQAWSTGSSRGTIATASSCTTVRVAKVPVRRTGVRSLPSARCNRPGAAACITVTAPRPSGTPQSAQNRSPSSRAAPHRRHATTRSLYPGQAHPATSHAPTATCLSARHPAQN